MDRKLIQIYGETEAKKIPLSLFLSSHPLQRQKFGQIKMTSSKQRIFNGYAVQMCQQGMIEVPVGPKHF